MPFILLFKVYEVDNILETVKDYVSELLVAASSFSLGYLTYLQSRKERLTKKQQQQEESRLKLYELELENLVKKQTSIQNYMNKAIDRLEAERKVLYERIKYLEGKVDLVEDEAVDWQHRYFEMINNGCSERYNDGVEG